MLYAKTAWWLPDDDAVARRDAALAAVAAGEGGSVGGERVRCRVYSVIDGRSAGAASPRVCSGSENVGL